MFCWSRDAKPSRRRSRRVVLALVVVGPAALPALPSGAAEWSVESSIEARTDVADNYRLTTLPHGTVHAYSLTPSLSASRNTESSSLKLNSSATTYKVFGSTSDDDRSDVSLGAAYSARTLVDAYGLGAQFQRDSTLDSELSSTGIVLGKRQRNFLGVTSSGSHAFSERWLGEVQLLAQQARYPGGLASGLSDYRNYSVPVTVSYRLSERDTVALVGSASLFRVEGGVSRARTGDVRLSWERTFDDQTVATFEVGEFRSKSDVRRSALVCPASPIFCFLGFLPFEVITTNVASTTSGPLLDLNLRRKVGEVTDVQARVARTLAPSGSGSVVVVQALGASVNRKLSSTLEGSIEISRLRSRYIGLANSVSSDYLAAGVVLKWTPSANESVTFGIRRVETKTNESGANIHGNTGYLSYRYAWQKYSF